MKFRSVSIMALFGVPLSASFCHICTRPNRPSSTWSSKQPSCASRVISLGAVSSKESSSADILLKMVEEISNDQFSPEIVAKMRKLEKALTSFLHDEKKSQDSPVPRPPGVPPPWNALQDKPKEEVSLQKAEQALEKLRERLSQEAETLRKAEEALQKSLEEEEILRKAEEALKKSREGAEKRKVEAIRRSEAAVASAEKVRWEQQTTDPLTDLNSEDITPRGIIALNTPRPTFSLNSLLGRNDSDRSSDDNIEPYVATGEAPRGLPILYNWVQYMDGSITGRVKGSAYFKDSATLSTSPVANGAKGGTIITTSSGTKYYLEKPPSKVDSRKARETQEAERAEAKRLEETKEAERAQEMWAESAKNAAANVVAEQIRRDKQTKEEAEEVASQIRRKEEEARTAAARQAANGWKQATPKTTIAPEGVPSILSWEVKDDGGIAGLIYGSPNANDGDYIETSPVASGMVESGRSVETSSGSRYFLSPEKIEQEANSMSAFKDIAAARRGGTITITKEARQNKEEQMMKKLDKAKPRSTFSLFDFFGGSKKELVKPAANSKNAPKGVPILSRWNSNDDGTITGVVSGSPHIDDGNIVTTSPISLGKTQRSEIVTTVSGSKYYLG